MARLKAAQRKKLKSSQFALPEKKGYPINDIGHGRKAIQLAGHASPTDQKRIKAAVKRKFPSIKVSKGK